MKKRSTIEKSALIEEQRFRNYRSGLNILEQHKKLKRKIQALTGMKLLNFMTLTDFL